MNTALRTTLLMAASRGLDILIFNQALGADVVVNGSFTAWTADNPNSWTITGESGSDPAVSEVGTGQDHTGAGTGSANWYRSSGSGFLIAGQNALTSGTWYEVETGISFVTGGPLTVNDAVNGILGQYSATGTYVLNGRAGIATLQAYIVGVSDITVDTISAKPMTLNAQVEFGANGTFELYFTLPGSPKAGQTVRLWYRASDDQNYWVAYVRRNTTNTAWDARLDRVSAGTATNTISVTGVGTPNAMRAIANGNDHTFWTSADGGGSWTQRGGTINNSTHATNTGLRAVYSDGITPTRLRAY